MSSELVPASIVGVNSSTTLPKVKSKKPSNNAFTQQRMPAWKPVLTPPWVITIFLLIFMLFTPLGIFILIASNSVIEYSVDYTDLCQMVMQNDSFGNPIPTLGYQCTVNVTIPIEQLMDPPIYLYYSLDNFYQNNRLYAGSLDDYQLQGYVSSWSTLYSDCFPIVQYAATPASSTGPSPNTSEIYSPCGLIAWSMFNDTFVLSQDSDGSVICNGPLAGVDPLSLCSKDNIAWPSDVQYRFRTPYPGYRSYPQEYYNESGHKIPQTNDTDFMVWMRTAALPNFRKLYRIINTPLYAGNFTFTIVQNYPVKSFGGRKGLILSTASWIGGKNIFLACCYLVVAGLSLLLASGFFAGTLIFSRFPFFIKRS